jgi:hypothetical protein
MELDHATTILSEWPLHQLSRYPGKTRKAEVMIPQAVACTGFQGQSLHRQHAPHEAEDGGPDPLQFPAHSLSRRGLPLDSFISQGGERRSRLSASCNAHPLSKRSRYACPVHSPCLARHPGARYALAITLTFETRSRAYSRRALMYQSGRRTTRKPQFPAHPLATEPGTPARFTFPAAVDSPRTKGQPGRDSASWSLSGRIGRTRTRSDLTQPV